VTSRSVVDPTQKPILTNRVGGVAKPIRPQCT
jgi:hypothetical protein